jgi:hypothetical protein
MCISFTTSSLVILLYIAIRIGVIKFGAYFLFWFGPILAVFILLFLKDRRKVFIDFFQPGVVFYCLMSYIILYLSFDMKVYSWDEFSHWALCTKELVTLNELPKGTTNLLLPFYPIGSAIFQYFGYINTINTEFELDKLNRWPKPVLIVVELPVNDP